MPLFRKKPVVIEAVRWDGSSAARAAIEALCPADRKLQWDRDKGGCYIHTLEGVMYACPGDWVIRGVAGELYPCRADIFEATYEAVLADKAHKEPR